MSASDAQLLSRWPDNLKERVADEELVLIVGAGVSRQASNKAGDNPPSWVELLEGLRELFASKKADKVELNRLIRANQLVEAAEFIRHLAVDDGKGADFDQYVSRAMEGPASDRFTPHELHTELVQYLQPRVILTTNYDTLLEQANPGYRAHHPSSTGLSASLRVGEPVIVHVHGLLGMGEKRILTRTDYSRARYDYPDLYKAIEALFLTRTSLFVGYGMGDPDLTVLLEGIFAGGSQPAGHYWLTPKINRAYAKSFYRTQFGVEAIEYSPADSHSELRRMIQLLG